MELFPLYHFTYGFLSSFYPCLTINKKAMTAPRNVFTAPWLMRDY